MSCYGILGKVSLENFKVVFVSGCFYSAFEAVLVQKNRLAILWFQLNIFTARNSRFIVRAQNVVKHTFLISKNEINENVVWSKLLHTCVRTGSTKLFSPVQRLVHTQRRQQRRHRKDIRTETTLQVTGKLCKQRGCEYMIFPVFAFGFTSIHTRTNKEGPNM